jgi:DNA sulfur modification protein DndD
METNLLQRKFDAMLTDAASNAFDAEDTERLIRHSGLVRKTVDRFKTAVVERHSSRIGSLMLDSFNRLLRKRELVAELIIDPATYDVQLIDASGTKLSPDKLSAGERQLLAISLLWGLARCSGNPLPVVIDTPLGRLDAIHRSKLAENYFPHASHQVVLLSTNTEIDTAMLNKLETFIGSVYHLSHDEKLGTLVQEGYFDELWQSNTSESHSRHVTNS